MKARIKLPTRLPAVMRRHPSLFLAAVVALSVGVWAAVIGSAWYVRGIVVAVPSTEELRGISTMAQATSLFDRNDRPAFTIFKEQRIEVPLARVSPHLVDAVIAVEDQRFYDHNGIDVVRVAGAALSNLREGRRAQGGSTITQQLARQSFLTPDKTIRRKLTEVVVAGRLEEQFTKDEILEMYLNKVYFGDGLYGVEAASLGYFGKPASAVNVAEAALLAGLVKSPSSYAPTVSIERATARRNLVLRAMLDAGMIDKAAHDKALHEPVKLDDALRAGEVFGQYFKEEVRRFLVQRFGWERVYQGGLKVYTTIDLEMQKAAETEVARAIAEIEQRQGKRRNAQDAEAATPLQAALVSMDPHTGEVRAMTGGRDFEHSTFNRATQAKRQAGSAFKPFVYAAALEQGFSPATLITNLNDPIMTLQGEWVPEDEHLESSSMTMRTALRTSSNRAAVRMLEDVGIPVAVEYAKQLGIGSVPSVPSLALGSGDVTLMSMTAAYAAFANDGMVLAPMLVRRVETTDGEVLYTAEQTPKRAVSAETAYLMTTMMADVVNAGTGAAARSVGFRLPAAGKTGTTNDYHDAWFVGFTPKLATGVWVGYDQPRTIIGGGYASVLAVPMWGRFMASATRKDGPEWFAAPATITSATICRLSGKLAIDSCHDAPLPDETGNVPRGSNVYTEYFVRGTEPTESCPVHRRVLGGALSALASLFGGPSRAVAAPSQGVSTQSTPAQVAEAAPTPPKVDAQPEPPRKRGFWSKVFGVGKEKK
jgi:1A family penicillin-binding protein